MAITQITNHVATSQANWQAQSLSPVVKNWLGSMVAPGSNCVTLKRLILPNDESLLALEDGAMDATEPVLVSHTLNIKHQDFLNARQGFLKNVARRGGSCWEIPASYVDLIFSESGHTLLRPVPKIMTCAENDFLFAFWMAW